MSGHKLEAEQVWRCMMAEPRQAVSGDSSGEGELHHKYCWGWFARVQIWERMASESSGESEDSLDAGVDLAQAGGGRLASPHSLYYNFWWASSSYLTVKAID